MTIETIATIELKDIVAVEFRCKRCGHASIRKLDEFLKIPHLCGNCESHWQVSNSQDGQALWQFLKWIKDFSSKEFPYGLRLQVTGLEKPSRD